MSIINELSTINPKILKDHRINIIEKISRKGADVGGERQFFNQYWQPYAWAAIIGFINNRRKKIDGKTSQDVFDFSVINNQAEDILKTLIIMSISKVEKGNDVRIEDNEFDILKNPKSLANIIDEYANGGFEIVKRKLNEDPDYFYDHNKFIEDLLER